MEVSRLNVMISKEAKQEIIEYQEKNGFSSLDEATNAYILNCKTKQ